MRKLSNTFLITVFLIAFLMSCSKGEHVVVGKWQSVYGKWPQISFYSDGTASLIGAKAKWTPIDNKNVKIEITENGETTVIEFTTEKDEKGLIGYYHLWGKLAFRKLSVN